MRLISEHVESELQVIVEKNEKGEKNIKLKGYLHRLNSRTEMEEVILCQLWKRQ